MYTYYMILRPVGIGCQPKGFISFRNYDRRTYVPAIDHEAWGEITYDRKLSPEEIKAYDMMEGEKMDVSIEYIHAAKTDIILVGQTEYIDRRYRDTYYCITEEEYGKPFSTIDTNEYNIIYDIAHSGEYLNWKKISREERDDLCDKYDCDACYEIDTEEGEDE